MEENNNKYKSFNPDNCDDPRYYRLRFIEICNNILYSDDPTKIHRAYELLFSAYRNHVFFGTFAGSVSTLEEVILKILNDNDNNIFEKYGDKYNPFIKFIVLLRDQMNKQEAQEEYMKAHQLSYSMNSSHYIPKHADLRRYLLMYNLETGNELKDEYLKTVLHKCYKRIN